MSNRIRSATFLFLVSLATLTSPFGPSGSAKSPLHRSSLTFAERVAYQYAIEEVYWRHRIWPKENPNPKPSLDEVMSRAQIEKKVEEYLRDSQALEDYWQRPITAEQLQAEMDRMARHSKQPEVLRELFAALGNDPFVIAECLARPALAERLLTNWYSSDQRFHGTLKRRAQAELQSHATVDAVKQTSGLYSEMEWLKRDLAETSSGVANSKHPRAVTMNDSEWQQNVDKLAAQIDNRYLVSQTARSSNTAAAGALQEAGAHAKPAGLDRLPQIKIGVWSPLQEGERDYYAVAVLQKSADHLRLARISWPKRPLELWLVGAENQLRAVVGARNPSYALPTISDGAGSCIDDTWMTTSGPPDARWSDTAVWTGSEMIIWGGIYAQNEVNDPYLNTGGRYNPSTDSWTATSINGAPAARDSHTAVWTGSQMIVWGGLNGDSGNYNFLNTGGRYDPTTDSWTPTSIANVPAGRRNHTAVWTGSEMIVWGGSASNWFNTGGRYNPSTDGWTAMDSTGAPTAREYHTAVWTGSEMIVWGGYNNNTNLNSGGRYTPASNSWIATSMNNVPSARQIHAAVWTGSEMIVWGGSNGTSYLNTGGRYNPGTDSWMATNITNAPEARWGFTAAWTGNVMIVWGGWNGNTSLNTGSRYNPSTDNWTPTTLTNAPQGRYTHTAVWTGNEMIVWGGSNYSAGFLNTGGRYNPNSDSWTNVGSNNAPVVRAEHSAVWTGSEMIVWGGVTYHAFLNTGGRYDPSTDTWATTSMNNVPDPRANHTAVWTGSEMIVWGGLSADGLDPLNTGGKYNPSSNSWIATNVSGAPTARVYHTAVWSGTQMIVWGGGGNTGGRYDPGLNSWTATNVAGAPTPRSYHTAVWTGTEMIVWGGRGNTYLDTGGRYNPNTDSWTTTNGASPTAREYHTAVWTGIEMIVWGGYNGDYLNTGGRYDPTTDSWTATNSINAPSGREYHTAVWSGGEMIVWGGAAPYGWDTGGKYDPNADSWIVTNTTNAPTSRELHTALWIGSEMIVWGGDTAEGSHTLLSSGGIYCAQVPLIIQAARSRKTHGVAGMFDVNLALTGAPGIECRTGGATNDYTMVVTFSNNVTVTGNPQAEVTLGTGCVGSAGTCSGNVSVNSDTVTIPLTNIANAQTIDVRLNGVNNAAADAPTTDFTIPMSILIGDTNATGTVNGADVAQTKARLGQTVGPANFRSDVNANGSINGADTAIVKQNSGTSLPP